MGGLQGAGAAAGAGAGGGGSGGAATSHHSMVSHNPGTAAAAAAALQAPQQQHMPSTVAAGSGTVSPRLSEDVDMAAVDTVVAPIICQQDREPVGGGEGGERVGRGVGDGRRGGGGRKCMGGVAEGGHVTVVGRCSCAMS